MELAIFVARWFLGISLATHGARKLFGWFGGGGLAATADYLERHGYRPGRAFALSAGMGELLGGLLTALGLFGPIGPALIVMVMLVATGAVHLEHGYFAENGGYEYPMTILVMACLLAFVGPGAHSLDAALRMPVATEMGTWIVLGVGALAGLASLTLSNRESADATL